jgi:drug/metabolite transporter (DMT)-like permease
LIYLLLAIAASTSVALMLKVNDVEGGHPIVLLAGNYLMAALIGAVMLLADSSRTYSLETVALGAVLALGFVFTFFIFAKAIGVAGTALATVASRLSLVIPVLLSVALYRESPTGFQIGGLVLTFVTLALFYLSLRTTKGEHHRPVAYAYLAVLLVGIGINDFGLKLFSEWRPATDKPLFLLCIFGFSLLYSSAVMLVRRTPFHAPTFRRGMILGVPNILCSLFLLGALSQLDAIVVYPSNNVGVIVATALAAALIWHERLNRAGVLALAVGGAAIVLMGMGA